MPAQLQLFTNLKNLILSSNRIEVISDGVTHMPKLELLDLRSNRIKTVPAFVWSLKKLKTLKLSDNRIEVIEEKGMDGAKALVTLDSKCWN
jgi:Leucine-rich repeat (LRR) protein